MDPRLTWNFSNCSMTLRFVFLTQQQWLNCVGARVCQQQLGFLVTICPGTFYTEICRRNNIRISGGSPCWICVDLIILHPLIGFHGRNKVLKFNVNWLGNFRTCLTWVTCRQTDNRHQIDTQTANGRSAIFSRVRGSTAAVYTIAFIIRSSYQPSNVLDMA